jgi:hypothetical protein
MPTIQFSLPLSAQLISHTARACPFVSPQTIPAQIASHDPITASRQRVFNKTYHFTLLLLTSCSSHLNHASPALLRQADRQNLGATAMLQSAVKTNAI